jgi:diguanylate cyclase (GGDEF)-like protein
MTLRAALLLLVLWWGEGRVGAATPRFEPAADMAELRDSAVSALALDAQGFLWVGMPEGLHRFDGHTLRRYPLTATDGGSPPDQFVRTLLADPRGGLWVAAGNSGLARLDAATGRWTHWARAEGDSGPPDERAPASNAVRALALERDGTLWVGTQGGGLSRLDAASGRFSHLRGAASGLPDDRIGALLLDRAGVLWVGTWQGLLRKRPGSTALEVVDIGLARPQVSLLAETTDGRLLVGSGQGELRLLSPRGEVLPFAERAGPGDAAWPVLSAVQATPDEIWLGGRTGIERRRAGDGGLIERLPAEGGSPEPAPRSEVRALLRDPAGLVWAGSYGGGLMRHLPPLPGIGLVQHDPSRWRRFGDLDVRSVLQLSAGDVWLGTQAAGVVRLNSALQPVGDILPSLGSGGLPPGRVNALAQTRDGAVWLAAENQLLRFDTQGRWQQALSTGRAGLRRLHAAADGSLWVGTTDGLRRLPPGGTELERVPVDGEERRGGEINAFAALPDGSLWVGGAAGVLRVADPAAAAPQAVSLKAQGLTGRTVVGLGVDRAGRLWADTSAGLHRLIASDSQTARFEAFPGASGSEAIGAFGANLLADAQGRIWSQRGYFDPATGQRRELSSVDGADIGNGWYRAYAELADGRFLFGGARGLLVVQPERFQPWAYQPPVVITELRVAGREQPLPGGGQGLVLQAGQSSFSLGFAALDYSLPSRTRYRYRLHGLDGVWTETSAVGRTAAYTNLAPGRYRLQVQGSNRDGAWSPRELQLEVQVQAAWWQTRWALGAAVLAGLLAVLAIVRLRTTLLLKRQRALEARVAEATAALQAKSLELQEASLTDPLTGLRNRRFLEQHLPADAALALRRHEGGEPYGHPGQAGPADHEAELLCFLIDVDHFKRVNDAHGHAAGDAVLQQMRGRLQQVFRATDYLVRWGGEEFLIVARGTPRERAAELAERAREAVAGQPFTLGDGAPLSLSCSVGFAPFPLSTQWPRAFDWRQVIDLADAALYAAKTGGRDRWIGLLDARADSAEALRADALRADAQASLDDWAATGRLTLKRGWPS